MVGVAKCRFNARIASKHLWTFAWKRHWLNRRTCTYMSGCVCIRGGGWLVDYWSFTSLQHLRSYQDGHWLVTVYTHGDFIVLPAMKSGHRHCDPISHSLTLSCPILLMPSARLGRDKYQHCFDLTGNRTSDPPQASPTLYQFGHRWRRIGWILLHKKFNFLADVFTNWEMVSTRLYLFTHTKKKKKRKRKKRAPPPTSNDHILINNSYAVAYVINIDLINIYGK